MRAIIDEKALTYDEQNDLHLPYDDRHAPKVRKPSDGDFLWSSFEIEAAKPPPMLYHYTNEMGFKGIMESGTLRFSDIFDMNDPSELRHGLTRRDQRPQV